MGDVRILVIDDDVDVATEIALALGDEGFEAEACASAEDGLALVTTGRYAVAVVDCMLPGFDGAELIGRARAQGCTAAFVGISGRLGSEQALMKAGACCFVQKPFGADRITQAVRWAVSVYEPGDEAAPERQPTTSS